MNELLKTFIINKCYQITAKDAVEARSKFYARGRGLKIVSCRESRPLKLRGTGYKRW